MPKLEDIFSGLVELTASERAYLSYALGEAYAQGNYRTDENRYELAHRVANKLLLALKLTQMVSPDGAELISVDEHEAIVALTYRRDLIDGETVIINQSVDNRYYRGLVGNYICWRHGDCDGHMVRFPKPFGLMTLAFHRSEIDTLDEVAAANAE